MISLFFAVSVLAFLYTISMLFVVIDICFMIGIVLWTLNCGSYIVYFYLFEPDQFIPSEFHDLCVFSVQFVMIYLDVCKAIKRSRNFEFFFKDCIDGAINSIWCAEWLYFRCSLVGGCKIFVTCCSSITYFVSCLTWVILSLLGQFPVWLFCDHWVSSTCK